MVRNGQKVHLSVEIDPNFAGSGKAYLVGMGVTDSPASLGVGIMKFSANERKQHLFSDPVLAEIKEPVLPTGNNNLFFMQLMQENNAMRGEIKQLNQQMQMALKTLDEMNAAYKKEFKEISSALDEFSTGRFKPRRPTPPSYHRDQDNVPY